MSWWGSGNKDQSAPKDFTAGDESVFPESTNIMSSGQGGTGMQELQQASIIIQQQLLVQQVINDLSDRSYEKCVTSKPSDSLSGSQAACIRATVNKWLDTNEFITGRLTKKSQQNQSQF
jgi:Tim10/DDP family zinc finger